MRDLAGEEGLAAAGPLDDFRLRPSIKAIPTAAVASATAASRRAGSRGLASLTVRFRPSCSRR